MPTLQLPQDRRWGDLGTALGSLGTQLVAGYQQKQVDNGVAQVLADQTVPQPEKLTTIQAKFGQKGVESYTNQLKASLLESQISHAATADALTVSQTKGSDLLNERNAATMAPAIAEAILKPKQTEAAIRATDAETALRNVQVPQVQATTEVEKLKGPQVAATTRNIEAETVSKDLANQRELAQQALQHAIVNDPTKIDSLLKEQGITAPEDIARVRQGLSVGGMKEMMSEIDKVQSARNTVKSQENAARIRANAPKDLPSPERQFASNASAQAAATGEFLTALKEKPDDTGLLSGAPIKAFLERKGITTGDEKLLRMHENALQQISQKASTGGGFFSEGRVHLASDITPGISKTPLANLVAADVVATQNIAELTSRMRGLTDNTQKAPLEDALKAWQAIKADTGSLESYIDKSNHSIVYYGGNYIDPGTLKPIIAGKSSYDLGGGHTATGQFIMQAAQQQALDPRQLLAALKAQYGAK